MKKILKFLSIIVLIISILLVSLIVLTNIYMIVRILFFGLTVGGGETPDSIWWSRTVLHGVDGISKYYSAIGGAALIVEIPISILCIIYQIIYFKIIRKKLNSKEGV